MSEQSAQMFPELAPDVLVRRVRGFVLPNERIVIVARHHLAMIIQPIVIFVVVVLASLGVDVFSSPGSGGLRAVFWGLALIAFLYMSWFLTHWLDSFFIVTNKRVVHTGGVINRKVTTLPLGKVNDFTYDQDALGRIFGYGQFNMESAGNHPLGKIVYIARPLRTYLEISNLLFGPGDTSPKGPQQVVVTGIKLPDDSGNVTEVILEGGQSRKLWRFGR